jgi:hypothetical protein
MKYDFGVSGASGLEEMSVEKDTYSAFYTSLGSPEQKVSGI